ncbi:MAG: hypothetical protein MK212_19605, partial [Saprospiraceae bacterium]|nr:hypothetical protein [Saprospiraceae bacterium]
LKNTYLQQLDLGLIDLGNTDEDVITHANEVAQHPDAYNYVFPTVKVAAQTDFEPIPNQDSDITDEEVEERPTNYEYINRYLNSSYVRHILPLVINRWSTLTPMIRLKYVLQKALEVVGYSLKGVFDNDQHADELNQLILFNNNTLDQLASQTEEDITFENLSFKKSIRLSEYLPEFKVNELIRNVCNTFAWTPFVNTNKKEVVFSPLRDLLQAQHDEDWTDRVEPIFTRSKKLENIPMRFTFSGVSEDFSSIRKASISIDEVDFIFNSYQEFVDTITDPDDNGKRIYISSLNEFFEIILQSQNGVIIRRRIRTLGKDFGIINYYDEPEYIPKLSTLLMMTSTYFANGNSFWQPFNPFFYPCYFSGLMSPMSNGDRMKDIVLLFYRGIQTLSSINADNPDSIDYPLASPLNYDYFGNRIGNYSLIWTGQDGIFNTWWKDWHEAIQRMRGVSYSTRLKAVDIANLDLSKKKRIDKYLYFIKRIRLTITINEIKPAIVDYMQIN